MEEQRAAQHIAFMVELDRLKSVYRRSLITDGSRHENSAEHSWHLALAAMVLAEYAEPEVEISRVLQLVLVHDIVEIDAGDTFAYDLAGQEGRLDREERAAERIYGILPTGQAAAMLALWQEFEAGLTADARFANALDRLQPMLQNLYTAGGTWSAHGITLDRVLERAAPIRDAMPAFWPHLEHLLHDALEAGHFDPPAGEQRVIT